MARLMDFMYTGATEARQEELPEFLTTATKLQIRGFGFRRLTDEENDQKKALHGCFDEGRFPKFSARKKICGRKSSVPKKLKLPENKITVSTDKQEKHYDPVIHFVDKKKFPILGSYLSNSFKQGTKIILSLIWHLTCQSI